MEVRLAADQVGLRIGEPTQVGEARRIASAIGATAELGETERGALAIITTELAGNIVKHARGQGEILVRALHLGGVEVVSLDSGPGIPDIARAMEDGYSTAGSPGTGLGAVRRLASEFDMYSLPGVVTAAVARVRPRTALLQRSFEWGVVCLPAPGETASGDSWAVHMERERATVLVADGLGHGPLAAEASQEAVRLFRREASGSPEQILDRIHAGLRSTRGAAAAVTELHRTKRVANFSGVGNISAALLTPASHRSLVSVNGTLGHTRHRTATFTYPWAARTVLVMHSDGLGSRWNLERYPRLFWHHPSLIAGVLYRELSRRTDDVTVLVVRELGGT